jgi:DNA-binding NtrC family response regulator
MTGPRQHRILVLADPTGVLDTQLDSGIEAVYSPDALLEVCQRHRPELVLVDLSREDALRTLWQLHEHDPDLPLAVCAPADADPDRLRRAFDLGARDCVLRPLTDQAIRALLSPASEPEPLEPDICREPLDEDRWFVASHPVMLKLRRQILQIAPVDVPVFICGESGVGKEILARMLHQRSARSHGPFVKVNCAALPGELLESELFGYEQGAFTGALRPKPGKFELAHRGTIFLDEIAEMPPHLQAKLLHVLQDGQFSRLGGRSPVQVDVRVIAATNTPVEEALAAGRLRSDLYYRVSVFCLQVPPLRARREDIPLLLAHFRELYGRKYSRPAPPLPHYLVQAALAYDWPGNLRELENFVKRYVILGDPLESFQELVRTRRADAAAAPVEGDAADAGLHLRRRRQVIEREAIIEALERTRWCRKQAAALLGISYKALLQKMRRYGLDPGPQSRAAAATALGR